MSEIEKVGHLHPLTQVIYEVCEAFRQMGFEVAEGPEIEDEFHNFDALNMPPDHPARDMQDTFWVRAHGGQKLPETNLSEDAKASENEAPSQQALTSCPPGPLPLSVVSVSSATSRAGPCRSGAARR